MNVNLACGNTYIADENWYNFDYVSTSKAVRQVDLLAKLPLVDSSINLVYTSHFLEHIPRKNLRSFLSECYRILKPGGIIRIVVPDLEEICRSYLRFRDNSENSKADFVILELLDQCVRVNSGGELQQYYQSVVSRAELDLSTLSFIKSRTGEVPSYNLNRRSLSTTIKRLPSYFQKIWIKAVIQLLPRAFRRQNISLASVGERHHWVYDYYSLEQILAGLDYIDIQRSTAYTSLYPDFSFFPLDLTEDGDIRKGVSSLFVEARKPL